MCYSLGNQFFHQRDNNDLVLKEEDDFDLGRVIEKVDKSLEKENKEREVLSRRESVMPSFRPSILASNFQERKPKKSVTIYDQPTLINHESPSIENYQQS